MDLRPFVQQAVTALGQKVAQITPEKLTAPTPCAKFDVKALANHIVGGHYLFADVVNGKTFDVGQQMPDLVGDDPATAIEGSTKVLFDALNQEGVLDRTFTFPFGAMPATQGLGVMLMETLVHGWDLSKGLGVDGTIDPMIAGMMLQNLKNGGISAEMRGPDGPFGAEVTVPDTATPTDKLVAFLGRTP